MNILFLGETRGGSAEYLRDCLIYHEYSVTHVDSKEQLPPIIQKYDVIIISDYPSKSINDAQAEEIISQVEHGTKFIMIGGWSSFNAQGKGYNHHILEDIIPVILSYEDDRKNVSQGLILCPVDKLQGSYLDWSRPPVICGYNAVHTEKDTDVLIWGKPVKSDGEDIYFLKPVPLLVKSHFEKGTTLAFMTDLAPHWCGGLVDWGNNRVKLKHVEIGNMFLEFVKFLIEY